LNPVLGGLYYKIQLNPEGSQYWIYSFLSVSDRNNNINPILQNPLLSLNNGKNLNSELYDGLFLPDMFKLYSQCFDVHG